MPTEVFRLLLSVAVEKAWYTCEIDVKAAFLQAEDFDRTIFVRPPKEDNSACVLWKLTKAAYGLVDSYRL